MDSRPNITAYLKSKNRDCKVETGTVKNSYWLPVKYLATLHGSFSCRVKKAKYFAGSQYLFLLVISTLQIKARILFSSQKF